MCIVHLDCLTDPRFWFHSPFKTTQVLEELENVGPMAEVRNGSFNLDDQVAALTGSHHPEVDAFGGSNSVNRNNGVNGRSAPPSP